MDIVGWIILCCEGLPYILPCTCQYPCLLCVTCKWNPLDNQECLYTVPNVPWGLKLSYNWKPQVQKLFNSLLALKF